MSSEDGSTDRGFLGGILVQLSSSGPCGCWLFHLIGKSKTSAMPYPSALRRTAHAPIERWAQLVANRCVSQALTEVILSEAVRITTEPVAKTNN